MLLPPKTNQSPLRERPVRLTVRRQLWRFDDVTDRDWFCGSAALSRWFDVYTLLVPDNEAFYIRTLRQGLDDIRDADDRAELLNFFRQESLHGIAHKAYWKKLLGFGIEFDPFLRVVNWLLYSALEPRQPIRVRVSIVAAIEHINASLGHTILKYDLMQSADRNLRDMFYWHFEEEIEHKAVAFKALTRMFPGYANRLLGAVIAFPMFYFLSFLGMSYFLYKERKLFRRKTFIDLFKYWIRDGVFSDTVWHLGRYLKPSFDPWDLDDMYLVEHARNARMKASFGKSENSEDSNFGEERIEKNTA